MRLELLLARADDHQPALEGALPLASVAREPRPRARLVPKYLADPGGDPNALPVQRWGVVAPRGARGDRLLALARPLVELRARQQELEPGGVKVFRVPPGMSVEAAETWSKHELHALPTREQPRYLLLLGEADEVSFELQQVLGQDRFVGRLAFPDDGGYEAYVAKVLRAESRPSGEEKARALFFTVHDGTPATLIGHECLVSPSVTACRKELQLGRFPAREVLEIGSSTRWCASELLARAAEPVPSVLFSLSHGNGPPRGGWRSAEEQRRRQGAMSFGPGEELTPEALSGRPFLPGGIWFYFACFGAGTPLRSTYYPWLHRLAREGEYGSLEHVLASAPVDRRPFVAHLPTVALANPEGPLAVIAHLDLAWTYAFQELTGLNHAQRFHGVLQELVKTRRAGVGLHALTRFLSQVNSELSRHYEDDEWAVASGATPPSENLNRAHLWMTRNDLAGYMLLGDPAVRLPVTLGQPVKAGPRSAHEPLGLPKPAKSDVRRPSPEDLEGAVLALMAGDEAPKQIAARFGTTLPELLRWHDTYRAAGREALRKLSSGE